MKRTTLLQIGIIVGAVILGFGGGVEFQRSTARAVAAASPVQSRYDGGSGGSGRGYGSFTGGNRPTFGQVTSINSTTMIVQGRGGQSITVLLTGNPTVTASSGASSVSAIAVGDTVIVTGTAGSNGQITATAIRLDPSFGGGAGGGSSTGGGT